MFSRSQTESHFSFLLPVSYGKTKPSSRSVDITPVKRRPRHQAVPGGTENSLWFDILDLWTRSHSQSGLRERSTSPRFPSKNWPLSRASLQLTISNLCLELGCPTTNRRRTSPPACASGVEKVTVPPTSDECRHC